MRRTLATFTLLSALGGPLFGLILFWWLPLVVSATLEGSLEGVTLATLWLITNFAILLPGSVLPAAALGALGTWLLMALNHGGRAIRPLAMGYGAVAGVAMSVLAQVQGHPYSAFGGGLTLVMSAVQGDPAQHSMLPVIGSAVAGGGTGLLLGLFIATRLRARGLPKDRP